MTLRTNIRFEEPPARSQRPLGKTKHERIADKLRKRPGDWALIATYNTASSMNSIAHMIRRGKSAAYAPEGTFEAVGRTVGAKHSVWARYTGPDGENV